MMFVALSEAIFLGTTWTSNAIKDSIDNVLSESNFHDIQATFAYGFSDEEIKEISKIDGIDEIEGVYFSYQFAEIDGETKQFAVQQLSDSLDKAILVEGKLPSKIGEVAVEKTTAQNMNFKIGDTITFTHDNDGTTKFLNDCYQFDLENDKVEDLALDNDPNKMQYLLTDTFVITGIVVDPTYLNCDPASFMVAVTNKLAVNGSLFISKQSFDEHAFLGYPNLLIKSNELKSLSNYSDEYTEKSKEIMDKISVEISEFAKNKNVAVKDSIDGIIVKAETRLDEAQQQISDAEVQIKEGKQLMAKAKTQLADAKQQLIDGEQKAQQASQQLDEAQVKLDKYKDVYNRYMSFVNNDSYFTIAKITNLWEKLKSEGIIDQLKALAIERNHPEIIDRINAIDEFITSGVVDETLGKIRTLLYEIGNYANNALNGYQQTIDNGRNEIVNARNQIQAGWKQYNAGVEEYNANKVKLKEAEEKLDAGKTEYEKAIDRLQEFKDRTSEIPEYSSTCLNRAYNTSLIVATMLSNMMSKLRYSMASLFLVVGLLVCYSAISRIVNDQIINIGTKKALGLSQKEITISYLAYTGLAILAGCIVGIAAGYFVVEEVLVISVGKNFTCNMHLSIDATTTLIICGVEIALLLSVTYMACRKILQRNATKLLQGPAVIEGKIRFYEKGRLWNKFSLLTKTIINNCVNDKRRVFGTIVGIAGSTALIVTAFTMNDNVAKSFTIQYSDYYHFDTIVTFNNEKEDCKDEIERLLDTYECNYSELLYLKSFVKTPAGSCVSAHAFVLTDEEAYSKLVDLYDNNTKEKLGYKGIMLSNAYDSFFHTDEIEIKSYSGAQANLKIDHFFDYYLTSYALIMDTDSYEKNYNEEAQSNAFMIDTSNFDIDELNSKLKNIDGYVSTIDYYGDTERSFSAIAKVSKALVAVYIALAVLMSFLVLLNLLTMFVDEKKRELIILMINGFPISDAKRYIYSDTIFLSVIGIGLGLALGTYMGNLAIKSFDTEVICFYKALDPLACGVGGIGAAVLTFIISVISLNKIKTFKLTDINKA